MPKDDKGKIKIRFFEVELEGGNETLLEGVRAATAVASRGAGAVKILRALPSATPEQRPADAEIAEDISEADPIDDSATQPTSGAKKARTYSVPTIIELNLKAGTVPFQEFCKLKNPTEDSAKYLVVAAWLKENLSLNQIGIDHIWTCFKTMGWGVQKDMGQPFRTQKKQGRFKQGTERGTFEITHIGIDAVDKMGPPAN